MIKTTNQFFSKKIITFLLLTFAIIAVGCDRHKSKEATIEKSVIPDFKLIKDVVYGNEFAMAMTFDIYIPSKPNGAGVILTNSGGWESPYDTFKIQDNGTYRFATDEEMTKSKTYHILSPKKLVLNGYTVFEVRHGSRRKFEMSEIVSHVRRAVRFIKHNSSDYGVDKTRLGLWGGSASGHLSLLIGLSPEVPLFDAKLDWEKNHADVAAIAVFAAPSNLGKLVLNNPKTWGKRAFLKLSTEQYQEFSPINYASKNDPPTLIMHGDIDKTVPFIQGELMYSKLQEAGARSNFIEFEKTTHSPTLKNASKGVDEALAWFDKYLSK
jgi:dienelactone hydrolase